MEATAASPRASLQFHFCAVRLQDIRLLFLQRCNSQAGSGGGARCVGGPATAGRPAMGGGAACCGEVAKVRGVRGRRPLLFRIFPATRRFRVGSEGAASPLSVRRRSVPPTRPLVALERRGSGRLSDGERLHEPLGGRGEDLQDVETLLPRGRHDGPEQRENPRALEGPEAAGDLHLDLHHPQISFGEVVGEGTSKWVRIAAFGFELLQPVEQIVAGTLFAASASLRLRLQRRQPAMIRQAHPDRRPIALDEGLDLLGRSARFPASLAARTASLASRSTARMSSAQGSFSNSIRPSSSRRIWALQKAWMTSTSPL